MPVLLRASFFRIAPTTSSTSHTNSKASALHCNGNIQAKFEPKVQACATLHNSVTTKNRKKAATYTSPRYRKKRFLNRHSIIPPPMAVRPHSASIQATVRPSADKKIESDIIILK